MNYLYFLVINVCSKERRLLNCTTVNIPLLFFISPSFGCTIDFNYILSDNLQKQIAIDAFQKEREAVSSCYICIQIKKCWVKKLYNICGIQHIHMLYKLQDLFMSTALKHTEKKMSAVFKRYKIKLSTNGPFSNF